MPNVLVDRRQIRDDQWIAVRVVVVEQERKNARAPGAGPERVVDCDGRELRFPVLGWSVFVVLLHLLLVVPHGDESGPIVDELPFLLHGPGAAAPWVVQYDTIPVRHEGETRGSRRRRFECQQGPVRRPAFSPGRTKRPASERASVDHDRCRRHTALAGQDLFGIPGPDRHADEASGVTDENAVTLR